MADESNVEFLTEEIKRRANRKKQPQSQFDEKTQNNTEVQEKEQQRVQSGSESSEIWMFRFRGILRKPEFRIIFNPRDGKDSEEREWFTQTPQILYQHKFVISVGIGELADTGLLRKLDRKINLHGIHCAPPDHAFIVAPEIFKIYGAAVAQEQDTRLVGLIPEIRFTGE